MHLQFIHFTFILKATKCHHYLCHGQIYGHVQFQESKNK